MSLIWICLSLLPVVCGWCGYPVITAVGPFLLDPECHGRPLSAPDPGGPLDPFLSCFFPVPGDPIRPWVLCPLSLPVLWAALLRGWFVCCGCDVLWRPSFPNYLLHCNSWCSGSLLFVRNPCALHFNGFVLNIIHILLCFFEEIYF